MPGETTEGEDEEAGWTWVIRSVGETCVIGEFSGAADAKGACGVGVDGKGCLFVVVGKAKEEEDDAVKCELVRSGTAEAGRAVDAGAAAAAVDGGPLLLFLLSKKGEVGDCGGPGTPSFGGTLEVNKVVCWLLLLSRRRAFGNVSVVS